MMPIILPALGVATLVAVNIAVTGTDTEIVPETLPSCSAEAAEPECAVQVLAELRTPEARSTAQAGGRVAQRPPAPADHRRRCRRRWRSRRGYIGARSSAARGKPTGDGGARRRAHRIGAAAAARTASSLRRRRLPAPSLRRRCRQPRDCSGRAARARRDRRPRRGAGKGDVRTDGAGLPAHH